MPNDNAKTKKKRSKKKVARKVETTAEKREREEREYFKWKSKKIGLSVTPHDLSWFHGQRTPKKTEDESISKWLRRQAIEKGKMASNVLAGNSPRDSSLDEYYRKLYSKEKGMQKKKSGGRVTKSIDGKATKGLTRGSRRT